MDVVLDLPHLFAITCVLALGAAGLKASVMHDGPGLFELVGMLWRGEIKSRSAR